MNQSIPQRAQTTTSLVYTCFQCIMQGLTSTWTPAENIATDLLKEPRDRRCNLRTPNCKPGKYTPSYLSPASPQSFTKAKRYRVSSAQDFDCAASYSLTITASKDCLLPKPATRVLSTQRVKYQRMQYKKKSHQRRLSEAFVWPIQHSL